MTATGSAGSRNVREVDRRLNAAFEHSWATARKADLRRRYVSRIVLGLGLSAAALLPLAGLLDNPADDPPEGNVLVINNDSQPVPPVTDSGPVGVVARFEPTIKIYSQVDTQVRSDLSIQSSPPSKLWHRTSFEKAGDEFWALPNARFRMVLNKLETTCGGSDCSADFETQGLLAGGSTISIRGASVTSTITGCRAVGLADTRTPYLVCNAQAADLQGANNAGICLWIRRSIEDEVAGEAVALDIRWEPLPTNCI